MAKTKRKQKTVHYKGNKYVGILRSGKVRVYTERTAQGQHMLAAIFNLDNQSWENESKSAPLPTGARRIFEDAFA